MDLDNLIRGMQEVREDHEKMQRALEAAEAALATARKDTQAERARAEGYKAQLGKLESQATTEAEWQKKIVAFESRWDAFCDVFEEGYRNLRTEYLELVGLKPHVSNKKRKSAEITAGPSTAPISVSVNNGPSHSVQPRRKFHHQEPTPSTSTDDRDPPTSSPRDRPELSISIPTHVDMEGSLSPLTSPEPDSPVPETKRKRNIFEDTIVDVSAKRTLRPQTSSAPSRPTWSSLKPNQCADCSKSFRSESDRDRHRSSVHQGIRPYACNGCDYRTANKSHLARHQARAKHSRAQGECHS